MKTRALVMAGVMALTAMATTRVAQAQEHMVVNVPFDFVAGNTDPSRRRVFCQDFTDPTAHADFD